MSMGIISPLYQPVTDAMLPLVCSECPRVTQRLIKDMFGILTDGLHTETLLFAALAVNLDRFLSGERDDHSRFGHLACDIKLSAVARNLCFKMQTPKMKLLHDVIVELPMAGGNYLALEERLSRENLAIVLYHSCGKAIAKKEDVKEFYVAVKEEQKMRTWLDATVPTIIDADPDEMMRVCHISVRQVETVDRIVSLAYRMVKIPAHKAPRAMVETKRELYIAGVSDYPCVH